MASDTTSLSRRARFAWGLVVIALGCYPIALGFGLLPTGEAGLSAPSWIVVAAGLVFVIAGFMILLARHTRANNLLAGILLLLFGVIGAWVSLFGSGDLKDSKRCRNVGKETSARAQEPKNFIESRCRAPVTRTVSSTLRVLRVARASSSGSPHVDVPPRRA